MVASIEAPAQARTNNPAAPMPSLLSFPFGLITAVTALAVKRVLVWQIEQAMTDKGMSKASLATKMKTSRSQLDRLLDPDNDKVQLDTIQRAALAVGKKVVISLEDVTA